MGATPLMEGVQIGPMDPERTAEFGQVGGTATARHLLRAHAAAMPATLRVALAKPLNGPRTKALDLDEVRENVELPGFLADVEDARIVGASVGGNEDDEKVLRYTVLLPSGRTIKWYGEYSADALPTSVDQGNEAHTIAKALEQGIPFGVRGDMQDYGHGNAETVRLRGQLRELKAQNERLRSHLESPRSGPEDEETEPEEAPEGLVAVRHPDTGDTHYVPEAVADDLEGAGYERVEQDEEPEPAPDPTTVEGERERQQQEAASGEQPNGGATEEPFAGYDDLSAEDVRKRLREDKDLSDEAVERILAYEESHSNRATVKREANETLDKRRGG